MVAVENESLDGPERKEYIGGLFAAPVEAVGGIEQVEVVGEAGLEDNAREVVDEGNKAANKAAGWRCCTSRRTSVSNARFKKQQRRSHLTPPAVSVMRKMIENHENHADISRQYLPYIVSGPCNGNAEISPLPPGNL